MRSLRGILLLCTLAWICPAVTAVGAGEPPQPPRAGRVDGAPPEAVDLRPRFEQWGLARRQQGARVTCSAFTVAGALEFAVAQRQGRTPRLSVEFLNWAANRTCGDSDDGGFFSDLWKGYAAHGICTEEAMPYQAKFDPGQPPTADAFADAKTRLTFGLRLHWIKEWDVNTGLKDEHLAAIKRTLADGWPVCGGFRWPKQAQWENGVLQMCPSDAVYDGHSVLLAGYRDDAGQPGGGVLVFRNTAGDGRDGSMPYAYAQAYMNHAVWVDFERRRVQRWMRAEPPLAKVLTCSTVAMVVSPGNVVSRAPWAQPSLTASSGDSPESSP